MLAHPVNTSTSTPAGLRGAKSHSLARPLYAEHMLCDRETTQDAEAISVFLSLTYFFNLSHKSIRNLNRSELELNETVRKNKYSQN